MSSTPTVAVVGAGVVGTALARSLALRGARVTVFERERLGAGTSTTTFAWINANGKSPDSYYGLNLAGMREHEALQESTHSQAHWLVRAGTYEWAVDPSKIERLAARAKRLDDLGYPVERITADQLVERIPELRVHPRASEIVSFPSESYAWPSVLIARLWAEARENGAQLRAPVEVIDVLEHDRGVRLHLDTGETWDGDVVVSAVGRWTESITGMLGLPLAMIDSDRADALACGCLGSTDAQFVQLASNLIAPELNVRPDGAGRLLLQAPDLDHRADPVAEPAVDGLIGHEMVRRLRRLFANTEHARLERIRIGQRARPADGLPAVGHLTASARVYVVATHSGITLAPLLGRLVADEIVTGERSPLLADFAPDRLVGKAVDDFPTISTIHFPARQ